MKELIIVVLCLVLFLVTVIGIVVILTNENRTQLDTKCKENFGEKFELSTVTSNYCVNGNGDIKYL